MVKVRGGGCGARSCAHCPQVYEIGEKPVERFIIHGNRLIAASGAAAAHLTPTSTSARLHYARLCDHNACARTPAHSHVTHALARSG
jgi:hypothetical protein